MVKKKSHESIRFFHSVENGIERLVAVYGTDFSEACIRSMKQIVRKLQLLLYRCAEDRISRDKELLRITPKEAVRLRAKNRKRYLKR